MYDIKEVLEDFKDINIDDTINKISYPKSTSLFKKSQHKKMNIIIKTTESKDMIVKIRKSLYFYKNDFITEILEYYKTPTNNLKSIQCSRYIKKIKDISIKNDQKNIYEPIIDDFVRILFQISGLDDGKILNIESQNRIYLKINTHKIPSIPDIVCKNNRNIIWMVEESKRLNNTTYINGDIQIACHILAAFQYNQNNLKKKYRPKIIYGFKMKGTKCFFYKIKMVNCYMKCLETGIFNKSIKIYKYPKNGIDINPYNSSSYKNMKDVFCILYNLKYNSEPLAI
jgi:hypothetical protein